MGGCADQSAAVSISHIPVHSDRNLSVDHDFDQREYVRPPSRPRNEVAESEQEVVSLDNSLVGDMLVGALPPDVEVETKAGRQASSSQTTFETTSYSSLFSRSL